MRQREPAITGVGCLSPNGLGTAAFYDALVHGRSGLSRISHFDPEGLACQVAGDLKGFDPTAWYPASELRHIGRIVPMAVAASTEALTDAGLDPDTLPLAERQRFGVILGSGGGSVSFAEELYGVFYRSARPRASVYAISSNTMGSLSSEVSMRMGLHGPSHVISTGCTSATDALGYAALLIETGRVDRVLCGGVDAPITPATMAGFCLMTVVATGWNHDPAAASRPFSPDRSGFVLAEGAWVFLLEARAVAEARAASIKAFLRGYGATCDAHHRVRLAEDGEEPARAIRLAMAEAGIGPQSVDYVSLHGTSTPLNDRIETRALRHALGRHADHIPGSAPKSMLGHPQGASGAAGVATALCAMTTGVLPPTLNLSARDPECDLDYVPDVGRRHPVAWAVCNCIGFGSKNSALVLQRGEGDGRH